MLSISLALSHFFIVEEIHMISHGRHKILHVICKTRKLRFRGRKLPQITKLRHDTARIQSQPVDFSVHAFSFMPHHILLPQSACPCIFIQFLLKFSSFPPKHILHDLFQITLSFPDPANAPCPCRYHQYSI